jgi:type II secretory pathway pseudopilin PulG
MLFIPSLRKSNKGFTVTEAIVYIALISFLLLLIMEIAYAIADRQKESTAHFDINAAAMTAFSRFSRDTKRATDINLVRSTLSASPGNLVLQMRRPDGTNDEVSFYLDGEKVKTAFNGTYLGDLTSSDVIVSNLTFRPFTMASSSAVRIEMTVGARDLSSVPALNFYGTYVLRGSYLE